MVALSKRVMQAVGDLDTSAAKDPRAPPGIGHSGALAQQLFDTEQVKLAVVADRSLFIESSIREVRNTAVLGGLFAVLVLFLFLKSVKSTLIIGVSIPISLLVTFAPLNLMGVSLNIMSLGGLALGVGMLVDSSIVVLESIYRNREDGLGFMEATIRGTHEVRGAVVASTLTTIGVFLPMVFVDGVAGQAFGDLGLAVVLSLMTSLVVALYLLPMLASRRWKRDEGDASNPREARVSGRASLRFQFSAWNALLRDMRALPLVLRVVLTPLLLLRLVVATFLELVAYLLALAIHSPLYLLVRFVIPVVSRGFGLLLWLPITAVDNTLSALNHAYPKFLRWAIRRSVIVLTLMLLCLGLTYWSATRLESELLPEVHQGEFTFELALPVGTPIEETVATLADVETRIRTEVDGIDSLIVTYGYDASSSRRSDEGEHTAKFKVQLRDDGDNAGSEERVAREVRNRLASIPDLGARLVRPVLFSFRTPIEVEVYGDDLQQLRKIADRVQFEMESMNALSDVQSTLRRGAPEVQIVYDRARIRRYELNIATVAALVRDEVKGRIATRFNRHDRKVPVVVRLAEQDRASVDDLERLIVDPAGSGTIRLASVAEVSLGEGPSEVRRVDGQRVAIVRANLREGAALGSTVKGVEQRLRERIDWPSNVGFEITGQNEEWQRSRSSLWLALGLSIFLVYVIMASQFESLVYPLIIMMTIPLAFLGTFVALDLLGVHLSIIVFLGMIMLAGIVVNNAIVLVDYINTLKKRGQSLEEAVVNAGSARLRPILMTTITTVLGLSPMALGLGDGAELRTPLALAVISGLTASTVLTLILIPTLYVMVDRVVLRARRSLAGLGK
jgi:HAE1 family hydrophobic/amphiphilic exporter-1